MMAAQVTIVPKSGGFELLRDGKPYYIKGAGGTDHIELLPQAGGNSIRAWSPPSKETMDKAHKLGLSVLLGLPMGKPRHGFDYNDQAKVWTQREKTRELVRQYRNHPALLMWAIGNETELLCPNEQRIQLWKEVEALARIVKQEDPAHPVITVLAGTGKSHLIELAEHAPTLDAAGINAYGGMLRLPENVGAQGWKKPWLVTEFGPRGHWEVAKTPWGLPIEDTSTEKAAFYEKAYQHAVGGQPACLGSYVFYWSQKQEKTHTWYGMFLPDGTPLDTVDAMTHSWTGKWPAQRAPAITAFEVSADRVKPGSKITARVSCERADTITWDLRKDVSDNPNTGGDREPPTPVIAEGKGGEISFALPAESGNYRLFVYARNASGKAATANKALRAE